MSHPWFVCHILLKVNIPTSFIRKHLLKHGLICKPKTLRPKGTFGQQGTTNIKLSAGGKKALKDLKK